MGIEWSQSWQFASHFSKYSDKERVKNVFHCNAAETVKWRPLKDAVFQKREIKAKWFHSTVIVPSENAPSEIKFYFGEQVHGIHTNIHWEDT
jgi:hypothetical protein